MLAGPAVLLENELNADQLTGILGNVKAHCIGGRGLRKMIAAIPPIAQIADRPHMLLVRREGAVRGAAFTAVRIAERQARRHRPRAVVEAVPGIEKTTG